MTIKKGKRVHDSIFSKALLSFDATKVPCILILFLCFLAWVIVAYGQNDSFNITEIEAVPII